MLAQRQPTGFYNTAPAALGQAIRRDTVTTPPVQQLRKSEGQGQQQNFDPDEIRTKLEKVLADRASFLKSAQASFLQFDRDRNGSLDLNETRMLVKRLCGNLHLPPVDNDTLERIFAKYDFSGDGKLQLEEFAQLYYQLLCRVRDKYYPRKSVRVRRDTFVRRTQLDSASDPVGANGRRASVHGHAVHTTIQDLFVFEKKLGQGSFGEVHLVSEKGSGFRRVCKTVNKGRSAVPNEQIEEEIRIMKELDHPNIIRVFDVYDDIHNIYIVMEHCEGGELIKRLAERQQAGHPCTERDVADIMRQLLSALAYMHSQHVVHKDLKPENVLYLSSSAGSPIKLIDFGLSEMFEKDVSVSRTAAGTALYMAPEVFSRNLSYKCDLWSAGVLLYLLLTGRLPFVGKTIDEVRTKVCTLPVPFERDCRGVSPLAMDLLKRLLEKDPTKRCSADAALRHPWFERVMTGGQSGVLSASIAHNMRQYMRQSHIKNALVNMLAHQLTVDHRQIREIRELFLALDKDNSGTLSHAELASALTQAGVQPWDTTRILQAMDVDGDNKISYTEFVAACWSWTESELNLLWAAFCKLDLDGDGRITVDEFIRVLSGQHDAISGLTTPRSAATRQQGPPKLLGAAAQADLEALVRQIDRNGNGTIEWEEFLDFMKGPHAPPAPPCRARTGQLADPPSRQSGSSTDSAATTAPSGTPPRSTPPRVSVPRTISCEDPPVPCEPAPLRTLGPRGVLFSTDGGSRVVGGEGSPPQVHVPAPECNSPSSLSNLSLGRQVSRDKPARPLGDDESVEMDDGGDDWGGRPSAPAMHRGPSKSEFATHPPMVPLGPSAASGGFAPGKQVHVFGGGGGVAGAQPGRSGFSRTSGPGGFGGPPHVVVPVTVGRR